MRLLHSFAHFLPSETSGERIAGTIRFDPAHPVFAGHFPGNPIVPGACLLQLLREIAEESLSVKLRLAQASNIKFLNLIRPEMQPQLEATVIREEQTLRIRAGFGDGTSVWAKIQAEYRIEGSE